MAPKPVTLTFAGDSKALERTFDNVGSGAKDMAGDFDSVSSKARNFGGALDMAGGAADASESKFSGAADLLDGLGGAFGLPTEGATNMMRSFGDLSGGFATLQPMIGGVATAMKGGLGGALSFIAAHPVILAIAAITVAVVLLWKHSETFRDIVKAAWKIVGDTISGVWNWVKNNWPMLLAILTGPIGIAVGLIVKNWDTIKEGFTKVKTWIGDRVEDIVGFFTGIGGRITKLASGMWDGVKDAFRSALNWVIDRWNGLEFKIPGFKIGPVGYDGFTLGVPDIPKFHTGGVVPGLPGTETLALLRSGERRPSSGGSPMGHTTIVNVYVAGSVWSERELVDVVHDGLLSKKRRSGSLDL